MALTRITKGVIKPNENYDTHNIVSTGIVTAIGLDINGNGDVSGDLNVGGVLTYEDVTSIDSVGLITARNGIDCNGDLDVDGHTNLDNVSIAGVTTFSSNTIFPDGVSAKFGTDLDGEVKHTGSNLQIQETTGNIQITNYANDKDVVINTDDGSGGTANYFKADGSTGETILYNYGNEKIKTTSSGVNVSGTTTTTGLAVSGVSTFTGVIDANGDLDVDGHTNLDNVSIAGVSTFTGNADFSAGIDVTGNSTFANNLTTNGTVHISSIAPVLRFTETDNSKDFFIVGDSNSFSVRMDSTGGSDIIQKWNSNGTHSFYNTVFIHDDIDVDGHTNLDNVSIAGVTTFTGQIYQTAVGSNTAKITLNNASDTTGMDVGYSESSGLGFINVGQSGSGLSIKTGGTAAGNERLRISDDKMRITSGISSISIGSNADGQRKVDIVTGGDNGVLIRPVTGAEGAQGSSDSIQDLIQLRTPWGSSAHNTGNAGARFGIQMRAYNIDGDFNNKDPAKSAAIYAVSEDEHSGYWKNVGLAFYTSAYNQRQAEKVRIDTNGNVGIGTISPNAVLHVEKNGTNQVLARFESNMGTNNNRALTLTSPTSDSGALPFTFSTGNSISFKCDTHVVHIDDNGKLGVGTDDPQTALHVKNGDGAGYTGSYNARTSAIIESDSSFGTTLSIMSKSSGYSGLFFGDESQEYSGQVQYVHSNDSLRILTGVGERVRINSTGVGIGTANPTQLIDVYKTSNDAVIKTRTTGAGAYFEADSATTSNGYHGLSLSVSGTEKWFVGSYNSHNFHIKDGTRHAGAERFTIVDGTGKVGITSTAPTGALDIRTGDHGFDGFIKLTKDDNFNPSIEYYRTTGSGPTWYGAQLRLMTGDFTYSYAGSSTLGNHSYSEFVRITQQGKVGISTSIANAKLEIGNVTGGYMNTSGIQVNRPHSLGLLNGIHVYTDAGYNPTASYRTAAFKATGTSGHAFACSTDAGSNGQGGTLNAKIDFDGDAHFLDGLGVGTASRSDGAKMEVFARGDTERGIYITDSDNINNSPYLRVLGKRDDGNTHQSFSGRILLASLRTNAKINSGRKVGVIMFGGNHTNTSESNILYPASIAAVAGGSYDSATDMPTDLVFYTGSTGRAPNANNVSSGDERLRIQSTGTIEMAQDIRLVSLPNSGNSAGLKVGGNGNAADNTYGSMAVTNGNLHLDARNGSYGVYLNWYGGANGTYFGSGSASQRGRIDGAGNLTLSGSYPGSDLRLKENIQNISGATDTIKSLVGKTFTWKAESGLDDWKHYGFIAQEVQKVAPDLVKSIGCHYFDKDDKLVTDIDPTESDEDRKNKGITQSLTVNNEGVTPILVEAMKELIAKVETLEAKVSALEGS